MLGAKQQSQQKTTSKAINQKNDKLSPLNKSNLDPGHLNDGYSADNQMTAKVSPKLIKPNGKGSFKTQ